ncbi:MAG TPA: UTP--glucose-1-phosphate uridylyltransferase [Casimicrobiaceae bacterium]|nr:UTP--glucose-1-phosphate uridylyltransferase [Casimicrobiaceae bacterium]
MNPHSNPARRRVVRAVFPVAGFGASFLPATKACPKEMLPIVDRPLIQYAVEEAAAAGLTQIIFVTGRHKRAIEDHFDRAYELEHELAARECPDALRDLRSAVPSGVTFSYVRQREASGLPDALRKARPFVGEEPFAVILPDDLIDADRPAIAQLLDVFDEQQVSVIGAQRGGADAAEDARFIAADLGTSALHSAHAFVKVPPIGAASWPVALCGRYLFTAAVWDALERGHDPMLARTVHALMERERAFACLVEGRRFDCGSKLGYLEAQFAFAQKRRELWPGLRRSLGHLLADDKIPQRDRPAVTLPVSDAKAAIMR